MENLTVKIKKLSDDAVVPSYAHDSDAGLDLTATSKDYDDHGNVVYGTGLAFAIPKGFVGYLFPRSSISKKDLSLANAVGVIDSGYRGEIIFKFKPLAYKGETEKGTYEISIDNIVDYSVGDKIGQIIIMPIPKVNLELVEDLGTSDRGTGGFGSTDPITKSIEENFNVE
ncbi:putative dUTP diphosphatase [Acinetobacter phage phiAC-1]|uniref:putative dUTP diphosphatase n=1 Tax=Acinetobacter phage phiAC-1 TaxID=1229760 RepID=UPI00028A536C|nr:putative dUTP diphosphatase [Acinetobacter phage phiAC-1]AFU62327.1 putative dUTP diphosphatase [Acinetobacter phage phiAC-1]